MKTQLKSNDIVSVGTKVFIPKGLPFGSTHPKISKGVTKRDLTIVVQTASSQYSERLTWAGTGGYWKWVDKDKCFLVD